MFDPAKIAEIIRETARAEILPRFRNLRPEDVREKKPGDVVTTADERTEIVLTDILPGLAPGSLVLGEEAAARDPSLLSLLTGSAPLWIIDPVDGTGNYANGNPLFAVIVAYAVEGVVKAGWILDPVADVMVTATLGGGAWSNGKRLTVDLEVTPSDSIGAAYGYARLPDRQRGPPTAQLLNQSGEFGPIRNHMCGGTEYIAIALGTLNYSLHSRSLPWDHAAGALITEEAGGVIGFTDGSAYDARVIDKPILAASSQMIFDAVNRVVRG